MPSSQQSSNLSATESRAQRVRDQIVSILDRLDGIDDRKFRNRRSGERLPFRRHDVPISVSHPGGSSINTRMSTRNLSASGIGFLYTSFLHIGTLVEVTLGRLIGGHDRVKGKVVFCAHVAGTIHQVGVRFDTRIFPKLYLDSNTMEREQEERRHRAQEAARNAMPLTGSLLLIDDQAMERVLLEHHLKSTAVKLTAVPNEKAALKAIEASAFDIILCDLNLETSTGEATIAAIRSAGFRGPICLLTSEQTKSRLNAALKAGAVDILHKPYDQAKLISLLTTHLNRPLDNEPIVSTLPQTSEMSAPLANYVQGVQGLAEEIRIAAERKEIDRLRQMCVSLRASGTTYGFARLYDAARACVNQLDTSKSLDESLKQVLELADLCRRVTTNK